MSSKEPQLLLVGKNLTLASPFVSRLRQRGCQCWVATTYAGAQAALRSLDFDMVLSEMSLPDGSAFPLLTQLEGSQTSLFFSVAVHDSCWWLPALARGQRTWGQPALRPPDFSRALNEILAGITPDAPEQSVAGGAEVVTLPVVVNSRARRPKRALEDETPARKSSA